MHNSDARRRVKRPLLLHDGAKGEGPPRVLPRCRNRVHGHRFETPLPAFHRGRRGAVVDRDSATKDPWRSGVPPRAARDRAFCDDRSVPSHRMTCHDGELRMCPCRTDDIKAPVCSRLSWPRAVTSTCMRCDGGASQVKRCPVQRTARAAVTHPVAHDRPLCSVTGNEVNRSAPGLETKAKISLRYDHGRLRLLLRQGVRHLALGEVHRPGFQQYRCHDDSRWRLRGTQRARSPSARRL